MNIDIDTDIDREIYIYIYARLHRGPRLQATTIMSRLPARSAGICPVSEEMSGQRLARCLIRISQEVY